MKTLFFSICVVAVAAASVALADTETSEAMVFMPLLFTSQSKRRLPAFLRQKQKSAKANSSISTFGKSSTSRISTMKKYSLQQIAAAKRSIHALKEAVKTGTATFLKTAWEAIVRPLTTVVITAGLLVPPMPIAPIAQSTPPIPDPVLIYTIGKTGEAGKFSYSDAYLGFNDQYQLEFSRYDDRTFGSWRRTCTYSRTSLDASAKERTEITTRYRDGTYATYVMNVCEAFDNLNGTTYKRARYNPPLPGGTTYASQRKRGMASDNVDVSNLSGKDQDFGLAWILYIYSRTGNFLRQEEFEEEITVPNGWVCTYSFGPYPITRYSLDTF